MEEPLAPLHALLFDGQGSAQDLSGDQIQAWQPAQGLLWLHLDYTEPSAQRWL